MADTFSYDDLPQTNAQAVPMNSGQFSFDDIAHINPSGAIPTAQQPSGGIGQHLMNALNNLGQGGLDVLSGVAKGAVNTTNFLSSAGDPLGAFKIPTSGIDSFLGTQNPGLYGKLLQGAGQYGPFALGAEGLGLAGIAGDAATGAAYGATQSPNSLTGGVKGAALNTALSAIPGGIGLAAKGMNFLKPGDLADQIVDQLSNGQTLEESGKSLASNIKNTFQNTTDFAKNNYFQPVLNQVGDTSIYSQLPSLPTGIGTAYRSQQGLYESLPDDIQNSFNGKVKSLNNDFSQNPTFSNAHDLQQQLGNEIGSLQYKSQVSGLDETEQTRLENYSNARQALKNDMNSFLTNTNPQLADLWNSGVDYWRNKVVPFYSDSNIMAMAKGKETNPTLASISSSFKNPNPDINTVVNSLPDQAKNSLLYAKLGTTGATNSADSLVKYFDKLDQDGMGSYVPQSLQDQMNTLRGRIKARNFAQGAAGGGLALSLLHPFSNFITPEVVGALSLGAGYGGPMLARMGQRMMPNTNISLSQALLNAYPGVRAAVMPNVIGGQ